MALEDQSPFLLVKKLETQLNAVLFAIDIYALPSNERKVITALKREIVDVRLDVRDYELSETRVEQLKNAKIGKQRLDQIRKNILGASEYNIFSAIEVAQLTAEIEEITDNLH